LDWDYLEIFNKDIPELEKKIDSQLSLSSKEMAGKNLRELLHPVIQKHALKLYQGGHLREAVLNAITAVFDFIRERTKEMDDGDRLVSIVMSLHTPKLILSELDSESGQNDQKGFLQIYKGAYLGIRNPKAHSSNHDLTELKVAQYLVFAGLLARRIEEATIVKSI
jgi:uncharacterized protein (TIGR02391 family)